MFKEVSNHWLYGRPPLWISFTFSSCLSLCLANSLQTARLLKWPCQHYGAKQKWLVKNQSSVHQALGFISPWFVLNCCQHQLLFGCYQFISHYNFCISKLHQLSPVLPHASPPIFLEVWKKCMKISEAVFSTSIICIFPTVPTEIENSTARKKFSFLQFSSI